MFREYGFGEIEINDITYNIAPTFKNIAKIGAPTEIVDIMKNLHFGSGHSVFRDALNVVNSCSDKPLPHKYKVTMSNGVTKLINPPAQIDMLAIIQVAKHCLQFGISSNVKAKRGDEGEVMTEFKASEYVRSAMKIFNISKDEAVNMTMTEFVTYCNDMVEDVSEGKNLTGKEKRQLILEQMEKDEKARKAKIEREGK